ncbi:MAG TPA: hypothetical protein VF622_05255 [Segetibacter sp.]|jgi:hypothetical protein
MNNNEEIADKNENLNSSESFKTDLPNSANSKEDKVKGNSDTTPVEKKKGSSGPEEKDFTD